MVLSSGFAHAAPDQPMTVPTPPMRPNVGGAVIRVVVNGSVVTFDVPPQLAQGTVFVPLRGVFERIGATVNYDPASRLITAGRGVTRVALKVGARWAKVNDDTVLMLQPAACLNGRTLVPLRFLIEALGAEVEWSPARREVDITAEAAPRPPGKGAPNGK